jgi:TATA-box binding protein (TBP) (component of TFIID and TFIIIB)
MQNDVQFQRMRQSMRSMCVDNEIRQFSNRLYTRENNPVNIASRRTADAAATGGDVEDGLLLDEVLEQTDETLLAQSSEWAAIEEYKRSEAEQIAAICADSASEIVDGPGLPSWYAEIGNRAIRDLRTENVVVVAYLDEIIDNKAIVARQSKYCIRISPSSYAAMVMRQLNPTVGGCAAALRGAATKPRATTATTGDKEDEVPSLLGSTSKCSDDDNDETIGTTVSATALSSRVALPKMNRRPRKQVSATSLIFPTGKITTTGAPDFETGVWATRCAVDVIAQTTDDCGRLLYPTLRIRRLGVKNVVLNTSIFPIDINSLAAAHSRFVHKIEGYWVGAYMQLNAMDDPEYKDRTVTLLIFEAGSLVLTSLRGLADGVRVMRRVYPILVPFSRLPSTAEAASDDTSLALTRTASTTEISTVNPQIAKLQRTNKRANPSEVGVARNMLALSTMDEHVKKRAALEMLETLRADITKTPAAAARKKPHLTSTSAMSSDEALLLANERAEII